MAEDTDAKSFTSWKMDWINAMMIGLDHREFRVSVCLLQHANRQTKLIMPSQRRIALLLGCSVSAVKRAIATLVQDGWLRTVRINRQMSNFYQFEESKREAMADVRQDREDTWAVIRLRPDGSEVSLQELPDGSEVSSPEVSEVNPREVSEVNPKHLKGTPEGNTLISGHDAELSVGQYARGNGEGLAPRSTQTASKQALLAQVSQIEPHRGASTGPVGTKPYVPPNFDAFEEAAELERSFRRGGGR